MNPLEKAIQIIISLIGFLALGLLLWFREEKKFWGIPGEGFHFVILFATLGQLIAAGVFESIKKSPILPQPREHQEEPNEKYLPLIPVGVAMAVLTVLLAELYAGWN